MSGNRVDARRSRTRNKVLALGAAGLVLAAGITVPSLAAWTDIEWVSGAAGTDAGVVASTFNVQQSTAVNPAWNDYPTEAGANLIDFSAQAATLTPGDTVYGWVQLRTVADSIGGTLTLQADTVVTADTLSAALTYGARVMDDTSDCASAAYATSGTELQPLGTALDVSAGGSFTLDAAPDATTPGTAKVVCFALTFPASFAADTTLQGDTVTPVWHFDAVSVS